MDLSRYSYISFHAPSAYSPDEEPGIVETLSQVAERQWPIVVHPDAIHDWSLWRPFGQLLCIENMDKRKPIGRTASELAQCFEKAPEASLCLDLGHARQVDPSMSTAWQILRAFGERLAHVHLSDVTTDSRHGRLSYCARLGFQRVAELIGERVPIILETPVSEGQMACEVGLARGLGSLAIEK